MPFSPQPLLEWFASAQRPLPWRKEYSPYEVWISEIMAQQTRIEQMLPYYERFLREFPSVEALAAAPEERVLKMWEGLGYYSRARNLHFAAKQIVEKNKGKLPRTKEELMELKGFGPYIASAVASIAFNEDVCVVDGNVLRVAARVFGIKEDISNPSTRKIIEERLMENFPLGHARAFNQGMMELGALVCVPENPKCSECPLQNQCFAFLHGKQNELPVKSKKGKIPHKHFAMAVIEWKGNYFIQPRTGKLLQGLWEFPMVEVTPLTMDSGEVTEELSKNVRFPIRMEKMTGEVTHSYSHFTQHVHVFRAQALHNPTSEGFLSLSDIRSKPLSKLQQKVLAHLSLA